ncbi:uncharacterized protein LTR77_000017 [Saxophila tyrrhenica]|uniref:Uncharacterized protein n=1 Tax=Saxophila tyrrhenica TaxID=1690608 RepID=A0AAV9PLM0_9PEZI|nr:hypothetical protein LTR77_000017 [Saxophila tyrrhenica]
MEKLILRSVMYGADKIPDSWFEKIPGGYFREKGAQGNDNTNTKSSGPRDSDRRHTSDSRRDRDDGRRREGRGRSDGHRRRHRRSRSSYDGGADSEEDDYYHSEDGRRRSYRERTHRRPRSVDDDRYGYNDGYDRRPRERRYRADRRQSPPRRDRYDDCERPSTGGSGPRPNPYPPNDFAPPAGAQGAGTGPPPTTAHVPGGNPSKHSAPPPLNTQLPTQPPQPSQPWQSAMKPGPYVPYSHVYGQQLAPTSPAAPPPKGYAQNPYAQRAPTAAEAGAGRDYDRQGGLMNKPYDPRSAARRTAPYDGNAETNSDSSPPPHSGPAGRDYSPSNDSFDFWNEDSRASRGRGSEDSEEQQCRARQQFVQPSQPLRAYPPTGYSPPPPSSSMQNDTSDRQQPRGGRGNSSNSD